MNADQLWILIDALNNNQQVLIEKLLTYINITSVEGNESNKKQTFNVSHIPPSKTMIRRKKNLNNTFILSKII